MGGTPQQPAAVAVAQHARVDSSASSSREASVGRARLVVVMVEQALDMCPPTTQECRQAERVGCA